MGRRAGVWLLVLCACSARPSAAGSAPESDPAPIRSPGEPSGPPRPPRELSEVDNGYSLQLPVGGACPAGTAPSERLGCFDAPVCACEYVCRPACGAGEVCAPSATPGAAPACECHGALEASEGACMWRGLVADPGFDDASAWRLYARSTTDAASAEIIEGQLDLNVTRRCSYAWGGTVARLPGRAQLPEGAALVFEYRAIGLAGDESAFIGFGLEGVQSAAPIDLSGRPSQMRACVTLRDEPWLTLLSFEIQANGVCAERVEYELSIDDVRLEADPSCG